MIPPRCRPWIEAALAEGDGCYALADIEAGLVRGDYSLLELERSASVLEVFDTPRRKVLNVFLTGGEPGRALSETLAHEAWLNDTARELGALMRMEGRRGWARPLGRLGWREAGVTLLKEPT